MGFLDDFFGGKRTKIRPPKVPKPPSLPEVPDLPDMNLFGDGRSVININGMSIAMEGGRLFVNGVEYLPSGQTPQAQENNTLQDLGGGNREATVSSDITIEAVQGNLTVVARGGHPRVQILGDVGGAVDAAGSVSIGGKVTGAVNSGGSLTVQGDITADANAGGSITCGNIGGDADAGGSIRAGDIHGNVDAGGSIRVNKR